MTDGAVPVVLVTGAAGGIGAAAVRRFAAGGWRVVATDLTAPVGPEIAHAIDADLTRVEECRRLVAEAVTAAGRLDCLVNSAGVWTEGPVELTEEAAYDLCLNEPQGTLLHDRSGHPASDYHVRLHRESVQ